MAPQTRATATRRPVHRNMTADDYSMLIGAQELAERLGTPVRTIYDLAARGELPHYRIGRSIRFDLGAVLRTTHRDPADRPAGGRSAAPGRRLRDRMAAIERGRTRTGRLEAA